MTLSSVCVSRIYYRNARNQNAGTGNFVYVGEYIVLPDCVIEAWRQVFKKWPNPYPKIFFRMSLNYRTKIENF